MTNVVFVAPYLAETTLRFARAVASLPQVRMGLVSQEAAERLPADLRQALAAHWRVDNALDPDQLVEAVRRLELSLGPVERLLGILEQLQEPLGAAREALGIPGMSREIARRFRDKALMKSVLAAAGLPCARHRLAVSATDARDFAASVGFPLVVKPPAGAGAKNTFRVNSSTALDEALELFRPHSDAPVLCEEFMTGDEHSFDSVFIAGRPVWHSVSRYLPSPLQVLENPWIQWCVLLPRDIGGEEYREIRDVAFRAIEVLGLENGLSHMEWFRRPDGSVAISEVGARPPGARITDLLSWAHDADFFWLWARLMVEGAFDPPERLFASGAAYLRGMGRGRVAAVEGLDEAQRELGHLVVDARLPRHGDSASEGYEGE
ncbi:MAG: ATP-grasp domain-containing protein, partial [Acidobacteriota bacterium]|nr:ATP-grasp domain-containing protein [Acidobacteriota bacterium]